MAQIMLYGLGGADVQFVALNYYIIDSELDRNIVAAINRGVSHMRMRNPAIESIYMIDNRPGLKREYNYSRCDKKNSIEARYVFRDMLEREGHRLYI